MALPHASVTGKVNSNYPIMVRVVADTNTNSNNDSNNNSSEMKPKREVWKGSQKKLFRKYAQDRSDSQKQIQDAVRMYHNQTTQ